MPKINYYIKSRCAKTETTAPLISVEVSQAEFGAYNGATMIRLDFQPAKNETWAEFVPYSFKAWDWYKTRLDKQFTLIPESRII